MIYRKLGFMLLALVASLVIGGCGSSGNNASSGETKGATVINHRAPVNSSVEDGAEKGFAAVNAAGVKNLGITLISSDVTGELTFYEFRKDKGSRSTCYGACAKVWPPLLTVGKPKVGFGAYEVELGTSKRKGGATQVTYAGHPVYGFVGDKKRGEANGNGIVAFGGRWFALRDPKY